MGGEVLSGDGRGLFIRVGKVCGSDAFQSINLLSITEVGESKCPLNELPVVMTVVVDAV